MSQQISYLICASPRSGSFLLCETLKNTGLAGQPEEYFNPYWKDRWEKIPYSDYLAWVIEHGKSSNGVFGAKLLWEYFPYFLSKLQSIPDYTEIATAPLLSMVFPNLHYIWITRQDKVRQAVSHWRAIQTQIWTWQTDEQRVPAKDPVFDFEAIESSVQEIRMQEDSWQHYFDMWGIQPFTVVYEEFIQAYEATALQILRYLNVAYPENLVFAQRQMKRQADSLSEEWVQRYHSLKSSRQSSS